MTQKVGSEALMELLVREGVEYVFGIPGATEILFMEALEKEPRLKYVLGLNEIVCCAMAEGYARASGKVGFLNLHTGPGLAAALPMLYNARAGGVPLVITVGQNDSRLLQYDPHLSGDIVGMGRLYTKWSTEICHAEDIPAVMQRAFKMAVQPPTGPVLVSLPQNVLSQHFDFQYTPNTTVYDRMRADIAALRKAVDILTEAENPVMLVESGVARCQAVAETVRFAERIGARVYQSWMSDVNFPVTHPLYLGDLDPTTPVARHSLKDTDVLIGVGCSLFAQGFYNPEATLPKDIKIVHIDDNPWEIGKNFPIACGIQGHIGVALEELTALLSQTLSKNAVEKISARSHAIAGRKESSLHTLKRQIDAEKDNEPIAISHLMAQIKAVIDADTLVIDDCWSSSAMLRQVLDLQKPNTFFRSRKGGSIGWGLPGALGVQLGIPNNKVVAICGDGSAAWSMQSLWSAARYHLPVTYVITNNATYRQVKLTRKIILGNYPLNENHVGMELDAPVIDFCKLAESMGVAAQKVQKPNQLRQALKNALDSGAPQLVEVVVENRPA